MPEEPEMPGRDGDHAALDELRQARAALEDAWDRHFDLYELAPVGYVVLGGDGRILETNITAATLLDCARDELIGRGLADFVCPEDREIFDRHCRRLMKTGDKQTCRVRLARPQGPPVWVRIESMSGRGADAGLVSRVVLVDVTEQLRAEGKLQQSALRLAAIVDILQDHSESAEELLDKALDRAIAITQSSIGYIFFYDEARREFRLHTWSANVADDCTVPNPQTRYELDKTGIWGEPVRQRRPIILNDFRVPNPLLKGRPTGHVDLERFLSVPVFHGERIVAVVGVANKPTDYGEDDALELSLLMETVWKTVESVRSSRDLRRIEWLLSPKPPAEAQPYTPPHGDLSEINREGLLRRAVGPRVLTDLVSDYLDLLETSAAVYEANGDSALAVFSSEWCRLMDSASRELCGTPDNREALASGRWLCHESCWTATARVCMETGKPADEECAGGLRIYSVPIHAGGDIIGAMSFSYGDPPRDRSALKALAQRYGVDETRLVAASRTYETRPPFIIDVAKRRLEVSARLMGEVVEHRLAEQALAESEERYRLLAENTGDLILLHDWEGRIVYANQAALETAGLTADVVVGRSITDFVPAEELLDLAERARRRIDGDRQVSRYEMEFLGAGGRRIPVEVVSSPIAREGTPTHFLLVARDMTERRQADERVRRERERLAFVIQGGNLGAWEWNVQTNETVFNETWAGMIGYSLEELTPYSYATWERLLHPDDLPAAREQLRRCADGEATEYECQVRMKHKRGHWVWILDRGRVMTRDASGRPLAMYGTHTDISEQKEIEESLAAQVMELRRWQALMLDSSDRSQELKREVNELLARLSEGPRHPSADEALSPAEPAPQRSRPDPKSPLLADDPERGRRALLDLLEERQSAAERERRLQAQLTQAQRMESIGRLAGGVAHDFNNMLGVILGNAELAAQKLVPSDPFYDELQEIIAAAQRSADVTRQLLAFARKQTIVPQILDLNETIEGTLKMLRRLIGENIDLSWRPGEDLWKVRMDPSQIDQVLTNLCINARDAIEGPGKIIIETRSALLSPEAAHQVTGARPGDYVLLSVSDTGRGMDDETKANIFEPFFTTKEIGRGTGLGLATVYGIVRQNDGIIQVESEPGAGTSFTLYLPRHTEAAPTVPPRFTRPEGGGHETILLVEDEPAILKVTQAMLERLGYTVLPASTPMQALAIARESAGGIDLLMTDVVMPEMNGRELAAGLLSLYPDVKRLFMSGYTADVIAHHGVLDKGVHFIQKPFSLEEITHAVRLALREQD